MAGEDKRCERHACPECRDNRSNTKSWINAFVFVWFCGTVVRALKG